MKNLNFQMQFSKGGANAGEAWAMDVSERDRLYSQKSETR